MFTRINAGLTYFGGVYAPDFVFRSLVVPRLEPYLGVRNAELAEILFLTIAVVVAAVLALRRFAVPSSWRARVDVGIVALACLLSAEFVLTLGLHLGPVRTYVSAQDTVTGTVFLGVLLLYATMPLLLARREPAP